MNINNSLYKQEKTQKIYVNINFEYGIVQT